MRANNTRHHHRVQHQFVSNMDFKILGEVADLLTNSFKEQLNIPRRPTTYGGQGKPGAPKKTNVESRPYASGNLYRNIKVVVVENTQTGFPELVLEMPIEGQFVNDGRRPGRYPPIGPIDKWVRQKATIQGIRDAKGKFISRKSLVFLVRRSIGIYGYGGNDFIMKGLNESLPQIIESYGEEVSAYIYFQVQQIIDKLRNKND